MKYIIHKNSIHGECLIVLRAADKSVAYVVAVSPVAIQHTDSLDSASDVSKAALNIIFRPN